jgi:hypothetical protein
MAGDLLALPVADTYERLPDKTLALMDWVIQHTDFSYLYKIDDDCHLDVATFLARSLHRCHHYMGRPLWRGPETPTAAGTKPAPPRCEVPTRWTNHPNLPCMPMEVPVTSCRAPRYNS